MCPAVASHHRPSTTRGKHEHIKARSSVRPPLSNAWYVRARPTKCRDIQCKNRCSSSGVQVARGAVIGLPSFEKVVSPNASNATFHGFITRRVPLNETYNGGAKDRRRHAYPGNRA